MSDELIADSGMSLTESSGMTGSVSPLYAPATILGRQGVVFGHDMTSEAALTKLSYLLALPGSTPEQVAKDMAISIRGELTEHSQTLFQHPRHDLVPRIASFTSLSYTMGKGALEEVRVAPQDDPEWLLNEVDYSGNKPLVSPHYSDYVIM